VQHWYTVIIIAVAVLVLMVSVSLDNAFQFVCVLDCSFCCLLQGVIIKFCGKKTPLVRRKRRSRPRSIHHDAETGAVSSSNNVDKDNDGPDLVQVHPMAIEAAVPLGKKVRLGEDRGRKRKEKKSGGSSKSKSKSKSPTKSASRTAADEGGVRPEKLAANLEGLLVNLPPSPTSAPPPLPPPNEYAEIGAASNRRKSRQESSPTKSLHKGRRRSRQHKSLSPEKTAAIRATLAESVTSISKSFEKLDLITGHVRKRGTGDGKEDRRRKRLSQSRPKKAAEVTIAKLGRFKFSLEVGKDVKQSAAAPVPSTSAAAAAAHNRGRTIYLRERKKSSPAKVNEAAMMSAAAAAASKAKAVVERSPDGADVSKPGVGSGNARYSRSVSLDGPHPVISPSLPPPLLTESSKPKQVLVSKKPVSDRPLWLRPDQQQQSRKSASPSRGGGESEKLLKTPTQEKSAEELMFAASSQNQRRRSSGNAATGGATSDTIDLIIGGIGRAAKPTAAHMRKYSFANERRPDLEKLYQLKRSHTIKEDGSSANIVADEDAASRGGADRFTRLKRQIQSQWDQSTSCDSSRKYESMKESSPNRAEDAKNKEDVDSDSDTSYSSAEMSKQRLSPPTQVQSLSEETTSSTDGRSSAKILTPSSFGSSGSSSSRCSDDESEEDDDGVEGEHVLVATPQQEGEGKNKGGEKEVISRRRILAANGIGDPADIAISSDGNSDQMIASSSSSTSISDISPETGA
jgi:hypothetical protein